MHKTAEIYVSKSVNLLTYPKRVAEKGHSKKHLLKQVGEKKQMKKALFVENKMKTI